MFGETSMSTLAGRNVVVIGGSRGVGRRTVEAAAREGAQVLAVARQPGSLEHLAREVPGVRTLALDATGEEAPARVFELLRPDILVLAAGVFPPAVPFQELSWESFSANWETDTKMAFLFCRAALRRPLPAGSTVVLIGSGAALAGSPVSGGYAGAKRMQLFLAGYSQKESDRLGLGLSFTGLAPRIMPDTALGRHAVAGYARYLGTSEADFIASMDGAPAAADVAAAVLQSAADPGRFRGRSFIVTGHGLEAAA
jgi:NAD(P)-dependent dehydrogenase (short-subunit alcohol dehydrogenase family)